MLIEKGPFFYGIVVTIVIIVIVVFVLFILGSIREDEDNRSSKKKDDNIISNLNTLMNNNTALTSNINNSDVNKPESDNNHFLTTYIPYELYTSNFKIDIVYTWVDGSDSYWKDKQNRQQMKDTYNIEYKSNNRFRNKNELKYSLRSLDKYFDKNHLGTVYILTDEQIPSWLNTSSNNIKVIYHRDIIPNEYLPLFNSLAIETFIHRIPNLREYFIYFNDDVMLTKPCNRNNFVKDRKMLIRTVDSIIPNGKPDIQESGHISQLKNTNNLLNDVFGKKTRRQIAHCAQIQRRSLCYSCESLFNSYYEKTRNSKFRSIECIGVTNGLYPYSAIEMGIGMYIKNNTLRIDVSNDINSNKKYIDDFNTRVDKPRFICLQDEIGEEDELIEYQINTFLQSIFPVPSMWEI